MDKSKNEIVARPLPVSFGPKPDVRRQAWKPNLVEIVSIGFFVLLWWLAPELGLNINAGNARLVSGSLFGYLLMLIIINRRVINNLQEEIFELRRQITESHNE